MATATLIASGRLTREAVAQATRLTGATACDWLDEREAAVLTLPPGAGAIADARAALRIWADDHGADLVVRAEPPSIPAVLVADMDSTMIVNECIDELALAAGPEIGAAVAAVTERAMRGELDFAQSLTARVASLAGVSAGVIQALLATRIRPMPGGATLIATLRAHGVRCILASGGFTAFADPVGHRLGFDEVVANRLGVENDLLNGCVHLPIVDAAAKADVLNAARRQAGEGADAWAIGDGANDLPMLSAADLGVAYRAKPLVVAQAAASLAHHGLDALLWVAGLPRSRWTVRPDPPGFSA